MIEDLLLSIYKDQREANNAKKNTLAKKRKIF